MHPEFPGASELQPFAMHGHSIDDDVRGSHHVEADRSHALTDGIGEFVVMTEEVQARVHARQSFIDDSFASIYTPPCRVKRPRRLMRQKYVDAGQSFTGYHFLADEMAPFVVSALAELERR